MFILKLKLSSVHTLINQLHRPQRWTLTQVLISMCMQMAILMQLDRTLSENFNNFVNNSHRQFELNQNKAENTTIINM